MNKAWFGPKRIGYGASPRSWEGWLALALWIAGLLALQRYAAPALADLIHWRLTTMIFVLGTAWLVAFLALVGATYGDDT